MIQRPLRWVLVAIVPLSAAPRPAHRYELAAPASRVWFDAGATMGGFRGQSSQLEGWLEFEDPGYNNARARIELAAASLKTGIGLRDRHLRETLETETHPTIILEVDSARVDTVPYYRVWARLTVRGVTRPVAVDANVSERGDTIVVIGRFLTSFTDFGMKPPARLLGTAKVKNDFAIGFECAFHRVE